MKTAILSSYHGSSSSSSSSSNSNNSLLMKFMFRPSSSSSSSSVSDSTSPSSSLSPSPSPYGHYRKPSIIGSCDVLDDDLSNSVENQWIVQINKRLPKHIRVTLNEEGRAFYLNNRTKRTSWLPPAAFWEECCSYGNSDLCLPYGWEVAFDSEGKSYFINHLNSTTTYEDPRKVINTDTLIPVPREITLTRDPELGFGFVAGSEKPVIVRFVKEDGPSEGKLLAGDQILKVNGVDMVDAPREEIIRRVKCCESTVTLTVCQPSTLNCGSSRRSALLTESAKKARLALGYTLRVRFSERLALDGNPFFSSPCDSPSSIIHNVLKVYLENNQTKTFKYNTSTTVAQVLESLLNKLAIRQPEHYTLCTEHIRSHGISKLTILSPEDTLYKIASRPGIHNLRCVLRMSFVSQDLTSLLNRDSGSFDYLYAQSCNDFVQERYSTQLNYDTTLTLAALALLQHSLTTGSIGRQGKIDLKKIDKSYGLSTFVPLSTLESMKRKEMYKLLSHFIKQTQSDLGKGYTPLQCKSAFLEIISGLPGFGAKNFPLNSKDSSCGAVILISPKFGIAQLNRGVLRQSAPITLASFDEVNRIRVTRDEELGFRVDVSLRESNSLSPTESNIISNETNAGSPSGHQLSFIFDEMDVEEFVMCLRGYHRLAQMDNPDYKEIKVIWEVGNSWWSDSAPYYHEDHVVEVSFWNYPPDQNGGETMLVNFSNGPPPYDPDLFSSKTIKRNKFRISSKTDGLTVISGADYRRGSSESGCSSSSSTITSDDKRGSLSGISTTSSDDASSSSGYRSRNSSISIKKDFDDYEDDDEDPEESLSLESTNCFNKLKAADSFELLHQIGHGNGHNNKQGGNDETINVPSESNLLSSPSQMNTSNLVNESTESDRDTFNLDGKSTSFKSKANLKVSIPTPGMRSRSGSSFGLSTPDVIPNLMEPNNGLMVTLRKLRSHENRDEFELPSADTTIYLGSDMIDLTAFPPPPLTPETAIIIERTKHPLLLEDPPTPFREPFSQVNSSKSNPFFSSFGQLKVNPIAENTCSGEGSISSPINDDEMNDDTNSSSSDQEKVYYSSDNDGSISTEGREHEASSSSSCSSSSNPICRDSGCQTDDNGYMSRDEYNSDDEEQSESEFPFHSKPRLSLEEYEKETLEKIEQVSKNTKKLYLLEMDEASECYWQS